MDNPQTSALPQHWEYKTQDEVKQDKTIQHKNGQSRDNWAQQMQYEAKQNKTKQYNTRMDNPQTSALPQHWEYKTQDEVKQNKTIQHKNGQSRDNGNIGNTRHRMKSNKTKQYNTRMDNPETMATLGIQDTG